MNGTVIGESAVYAIGVIVYLETSAYFSFFLSYRIGGGEKGICSPVRDVSGSKNIVLVPSGNVNLRSVRPINSGALYVGCCLSPAPHTTQNIFSVSSHLVCDAIELKCKLRPPTRPPGNAVSNDLEAAPRTPNARTHAKTPNHIRPIGET